MKFHDPLLQGEKLERGPDALWASHVNAANKAAHIQGYYKVYKGEMKDPNDANHSRRETADARRGRLEGIIAQVK